MKTYARTSPMTGDEFKALRRGLDLSVQELAWLLDCQVQTLRNLEGGGAQRPKHPSRQMALLLQLLRYPNARIALETLARQRQA